MGMKFGDKPCRDPNLIITSLQSTDSPVLFRGWVNNANKFTCPLGDQPGTGLILMLKKHYDELQISRDNYQFDLVVSSRTRFHTIKNLRPLRAYCITPGADDDPSQTMAILLADPRWDLLQKFHNKAYNVRKAPGGEQITETLDYGGSGGTSANPVAWSWHRMGEDLWDSLDRDEAWPGWPFTPDGDPESWHFWNVPALTALQAVARRLGCSVKWDPLTDALSIVQLGAADSTFDEAVEELKTRDRNWDDHWDEPDPFWLPEKIRVVFRRLLAEATGNPYYTEDVTYPTAEFAGSYKTGTIATVWDDLLYTGSNASACTTRAEERADDYARINENFNPRLFRRYHGLPAGTAMIGSKCWSATWQDVGQGTQFIIERAPLETVDWSQYLHGVGETVTSVQCVGGDVEETLLMTWGGRPFRVGV